MSWFPVSCTLITPYTQMCLSGDERIPCALKNAFSSIVGRHCQVSEESAPSISTGLLVQRSHRPCPFYSNNVQGRQLHVEKSCFRKPPPRIPTHSSCEEFEVTKKHADTQMQHPLVVLEPPTTIAYFICPVSSARQMKAPSILHIPGCQTLVKYVPYTVHCFQMKHALESPSMGIWLTQCTVLANPIIDHHHLDRHAHNTYYGIT